MDTTETGDARLEADRARHPIDEANLESQSTVELVETLGRRLTALMRAEVALLKTDTIARARGVVGAAAAGAAGALLAACALGVLCAAGLLALAIVLPAWAAALAMAGGLGLLAVICGLVARTLARRAAPPIPRTAIDQLREDVTWLKSPRRSSSGSH